MKTIYTSVIFVLVLIMQITRVYSQPLNGSYTVGEGGNYSNLTNAVEALKQRGVNGPVTFNIYRATYNEQIRIPEITGASAINTITFQSQELDSTSVIIQYYGSWDYNYVIKLAGADYITFRKLTIEVQNDYYANGILLDSVATNNHFENNIFRNVYSNCGEGCNNNAALIASQSDNNNFNTITGNYFEFNPCAIGFSNATNLKIENNTFQNQILYSISLVNVNYVTIKKNSILSTNWQYGGISIELSAISNLLLTENVIERQTGGKILDIYDSNAYTAGRTTISNNMFSTAYVDDNAIINCITNSNIGIYNNSFNYFGGNSATSELLSITSNNNLSFINNTVTNKCYGRALSFYGSNSIDTSDYNNLYTSGPNLIFDNENIATLQDYQNSTGFETHSISVNNAYSSNSDLHTTDSRLNGKGLHLANISKDIDGETRNATTPDIGADEFDVPSVDAGVSNYTYPSDFVRGVHELWLHVFNYGTQPITSLQLHWTFNGGAQKDSSWTGNIAPGATLIFSIGKYNFLKQQDYILKGWTSLPNGINDPINSNDTLTATLRPNFAGEYTIGGTNPDYATFGDAFNAIQNKLLQGPVVFKVRSGTYNEQLYIGNYSNITKQTPVTFESESGDSSQVVVSTYSAYSYYNYVFFLYNTSYLTFKGITFKNTGNSYSRSIQLRYASNITFSNCVFEGNAGGENGALIFSDYASAENNNLFRNNYFKGGGYGLLLQGQYNNLDKGTRIENNTLENQTTASIYCYYQDSVLVKNNIIKANSYYSGYIGINCNDCENAFEITGNNITILSYGNGISFGSCNQNGLTSSLIANNFISVPENGIYTNYSYHTNIYYNNINITGNNGRALTIDGYNNDAGNIDILNNNFVCNATNAYSLFLNASAAIARSDYNNYFTTGQYLAYISNYITNLEDLKIVTGKDLHSKSISPGYVSATDLHVTEPGLNGAATPITTITTDFDGQPRNAIRPDIGADEFTVTAIHDAGLVAVEKLKAPFNSGNRNVVVSLKNFGGDTLRTVSIDWNVNGIAQPRYNWTGNLATGDTTFVTIGTYNFKIKDNYTLQCYTLNPNGATDTKFTNDTASFENIYAALAGNYTVGGLNPDFADFAEISSSLEKGGITGPVSFKIRPGTYNEQVILSKALGSSATNTIVFEAENGDSTSVILTFDANYSGNYTLQCNAAEHVTFSKITLQSLNYTYSNIVEFKSDPKWIYFNHCVFNSAYNSGYMVSSYGSRADYTKFTGNKFLNGYGGIYIQSGSYDVLVEDNIFENLSASGVYLYYTDSVIIRNNVFTSNVGGNCNAINVSYYSRKLYVVKNKVNFTNGGTGFYFYNINGISKTNNYIANNFIYIGGSSFSKGVSINISYNLNFVFNTVHIANTNANSRAFDFYDNYNTSNSLYCNNLINSGGGYVWYTSSKNIITNSDYNNYYTTGTSLVYNGGNVASLGELQTSSGKDLNSLNENTPFVSATDLHTMDATINNKAIPFAGITDDIDGDLRDPLTPDIGADEFKITIPNDAGIVAFKNIVKPLNAQLQPINLVLKNFGNDTLKTVTINWIINGVNQGTYNWTGKLKSGDTTIITVGNYTFQIKDLYNLKAWTSLPNGLTDPINGNDTARISNLYAALNGTYVLGSSGTFTSFTEAVNYLDKGGITGPVTFKVMPGTYTDQISIPAIVGSKTINPITFESQNGDSTSVILQFSANSNTNYTVELNGVSDIRLNKITVKALNTSYSNVIVISKPIKGLIISGCVIQTIEATYGALIQNYYQAIDSSSIVNNHFLDGYIGLIFTGGLKNSSIAKNLFENQFNYGIQVSNIDNGIISENKIQNSISTGYYTGIYVTNSSKYFEINKNKIEITNGGNGISFYYVNGNYIKNSLISNNFISIGGTAQSQGMECSGSSMLFAYNSINIYNTNTSSRAVYVGGNGSILKNNNLVNSGGGYALYGYYNINSDYNNIYTTGTNLVYYNGDYTNLAVYQNAVTYEKHSISVDPRYITATNLHSKEITLNGAATPVAEVTTDIDNELRDVLTPDIGADEFEINTLHDAGIVAFQNVVKPMGEGNNPVRVFLKNYGKDTLQNVTINWNINGVNQPLFNWSGALKPGDTTAVTIGNYTFLIKQVYQLKAWTTMPNGNTDPENYNDSAKVSNFYAALKGVYTIGTPSGTFTTFTEAADYLDKGGVTSAVTFKVKPGTYIEHIVVSNAKGSSKQNAITFEPENGDSTSVILQSVGEYYKNYVIQLNGTNHVTLRKLTLESLHESYANVIQLVGSNSGINVSNCIIKAASVNSGNLISNDGSSLDSCSITNNTLLNGYTGIYSNSAYKNSVISNNRLLNQKDYGINLNWFENIGITQNSITTNSSSNTYAGIYISGSNSYFIINKNKLQIPNSGTGIYFWYANGTIQKNALVANNFITIGGTAVSFGINCSGNYVLFGYNSVNITNSNLQSTAFNLASNYITLKNNNLVNKGGGYALYTSYNNGSSDFNNLYTTGANLVYFNGNKSTLADYKITGASELNSISFNPKFVSDTDLHVKEIALNGAGTPLSEVTDDIDGELRNASFPDIGADEFESNIHDIGIYAVSPTSGCKLSNNTPVKVTVKNYGVFPESGFEVVSVFDNSDTSRVIYNQTLQPNGTVELTLPKNINLAVLKSYKHQLYIKYAADENRLNDTLLNIIDNMPALQLKLTRDTAICLNSSVDLSVSGAGVYQWSNGITATTQKVFPTTTKTYYVEGRNQFNCVATDSVKITVLALPAKPLITPVGNIIFCNDSSVTLKSNTSKKLLWSTGDTLPSIKVKLEGNYFAVYTDSFGCKSYSDVASITKAKAPVIWPADTTVCSTDTFTIRTYNGNNYAWNTGATSKNIVVNPTVSTIFSVRIKTSQGCIDTLYSKINVRPSQMPTMVSDMAPVSGSANLSMPLELSWSPGVNTSYYDIYIWPENTTKPTSPYVANYSPIRYKFDEKKDFYGVTYNWQVVSKYFGCKSIAGPVQTFNLRYLPDLVVTNVQAPQNAYTGQEIEVTWDVKNQGLGSTLNIPWYDQLGLSLDSTSIDDFYNLGYVKNMTYLEPGQSYSNKVAFKLPEFKDGKFYVSDWVNRNGSNTLLETNHDNNQLIRQTPMVVKLAPVPDLYVTDINSATTFFSEDTIALTWKVINKGKAKTQSGTWTDRVFISTDYDKAKQYYLGDFRHVGDTLKPGESYTVTNRVAIPEAIFGKYFFYVYTDVGNQIYEHAYDGNNLSQGDTLNVILRPPADLEVSDIVIPATTTNISTANIRYTVTNIGNSSPLDKEFNDMIYLSKYPTLNVPAAKTYVIRRIIGTSGIPQGLQYFASEDIQIPNDIEPGDYYVFVKTDASNEVFEYTFKDNNLLRSAGKMKITVAPYPDLAVTGFNVPDSIGSDQSITVNYLVKNVGTAIAKGSWNDKIYISDNNGILIELKSIKRYEQVAIDGSYQVSTEVLMPKCMNFGSGKYRMLVHVNDGDNLYEHQEKSNNILTDTIFIRPSDLFVSQVNVPTVMNTGTRVSISYTVANNALVNTSACYWTDNAVILDSTYNIFLNSDQINIVSNTVKPGEAYNASLTFTVPEGAKPGNYYIRVNCDITNANNERVTTNNYKMVPVRIEKREPTDLIITGLTAPSTGISGQPVTLSWTVSNVGPGNTIANTWNDVLVLSVDTIPDEYDIKLVSYNNSGVLNSGGSYTQTRTVYLPISCVGNYYLLAKTDYSIYNWFGNEYEMNAEGNNISRKLILVKQQPPSDLTVTNIDAPAQAITGEQVTVSWTVKNNGPNKAAGFLTDMVYFSKDKHWDVDDPYVGALEYKTGLRVGTDTTVTLTTELTTAAPGNYYVIVRTDNRNNINEVNDYNNELITNNTVKVEIPELPLYTNVDAVLKNNKALFYRIEVPDSLVGESLIIKLTGDSVETSNYLYLSYDKLPDRSDFDFNSRAAISGTQEVIVPEAQKGDYYLLVHGNKDKSVQQDIRLWGGKIKFQVRTIDINHGGNRGLVTSQIYGVKFDANMKILLRNAGVVIRGDSLIITESNYAFVTFNLSQAPLGMYDVVAISYKGDTAILPKAFTVEESSPLGLVTSVKSPGSMILNTITTIAVQFANEGNNDIAIPKFSLISLSRLPIALTRKDLINNMYKVEFELREVDGPQHSIRPGAVNSLYIWVKASHAGPCYFRFE